MGPLLTLALHSTLLSARERAEPAVQCSLDLERSLTRVRPGHDHWIWRDASYPYMQVCKPRTIYYWDGTQFEPVARFGRSLVKLIPTPWGAPTFEIDGIKMLPTAQVSPWADAQRKVALVEPRGKRLLDTCGGLGYFAACSMQASALQVQSYEINPDVIWLRGLNPWSPDNRWTKPRGPSMSLTMGDIAQHIVTLPDQSFDAVLHDPPRFGIAGELYSQEFYGQLARVLKRHGRLFHYTGTPNKVSRGRDLPSEVARRLQRAGFEVQANGDGLLARKVAG